MLSKNKCGTEISCFWIFILVQIPDQMNIPGLRNSLIKILRDYELLVRMQHGCLQVTQVDSGRLFGKHMSNCKRAVIIDLDKGCGVCRCFFLIAQIL